MIRSILYLIIICLAQVCFILPAKGQTSTPSWAESLELEFLSPTIFYSSLDRPKLKVRLTNAGNDSLKYVGFDFRPDNQSKNLPGCATFPNGGFINLAPGESTIVSTWTSCYFGDGLTFEEGTSDHTAEFHFIKNNEVYVFRQEFQIVNDEERTSPASANGEDIRISGRINILGGYAPQVRLYAKTIRSREIEVEIQPDGPSSFTFDFLAQAGFDWYLVSTADQEGEETLHFPKQTISVSEFSNSEDITMNIEAADYAYQVNFELRDAIITPTGFWRGAVSESEETVAFIPGQENWYGNNDDEKRPYKEQSTIYKYNFEGEKLWEYQPGYECWGGDMSADGKKVVYQLVPNGGTYGIGVLDGKDGELLWKIEFTEFNPLARALEGLEAKLNKDGSIIAVGTVPTGVVSLFDANNGELIRQFPNGPDGDDNWGQVRGLLFDDSGEFLYVGSGDNYLRKVKVIDGSVEWKAFIGGWPFVNGLEMSSDGTFIVTGTKSFDQARVNTATGETVWIKDHGSLESSLSHTDRYVANFGGVIMDAETGDFITNLHQGAETHFFAGDTLVAKLDRNIAPYYVSGKPLTSSEASGGGQGGGEQSQWSYVKVDGSLAIIAYRDMVTDPGNQVGIAFYTGNIQREELDPNDSPTDISLSTLVIDENKGTNALVATMSTQDKDEADQFTYELVEGEGDIDNESFTIENDQLISLLSLDFEEKSSYQLRIKSTDSNRAEVSKTFTLSVNDQNDSPSDLILSENEINENEETGQTIGELSSIDQDTQDTHTYSLTEGEGDEDNELVSIEGGVLKSTQSYNFEEKDNLTVRIKTTDENGESFEKQFSISITDQNDAPTGLSLSSSNIEEGLPMNTVVGILSTEDEDQEDSFTYQLISGDGDTDNDAFLIDGNQLLTKEVFDFEVKENYQIRVSTSDLAGEVFETNFNISIDLVTDIDTSPILVENVFPNPSTNVIHIETAQAQGPLFIHLYDMNGQLKLSTNALASQRIEVDISDLKPAIYLLLVQDKEGSYFTRKLIIH